MCKHRIWTRFQVLVEIFSMFSFCGLSKDKPKWIFAYGVICKRLTCINMVLIHFLFGAITKWEKICRRYIIIYLFALISPNGKFSFFSFLRVESSVALTTYFKWYTKKSERTKKKWEYFPLKWNVYRRGKKNGCKPKKKSRSTCCYSIWLEKT